MTRARWIGLALGAAGLFFLFEPWVLDWSNGRIVFGHLLVLGAAFTNAATMVHIRHHGGSRATAMQLLPWQMLAGAVPMAAIAFIVDGWPRIEWTPQLIGIVAYQAVLVHVAVWARQIILRRIPATSTNLILMAVPVVGLLSSAILVDDPLTVGAVVGLLLIVIGVGTNIKGAIVDPVT